MTTRKLILFVAATAILATVLPQCIQADQAASALRRGSVRGRTRKASSSGLERVLRKQHRIEDGMNAAWNDSGDESGGSDSGYDYYGKKKGKKSSRRGKKGSKSRSSSSGSDRSNGSNNGVSDDGGNSGDDGNGNGGYGSGDSPAHPPSPRPPQTEPTVSILGQTFQPFAIATVPVNPALNNTSGPDDPPVPIIGTVYLYDNYTRTVTNVNTFEFNVTIDGTILEVWAKVAGFCTRTSSSTMGEAANGYCHFTYVIEDPRTMFTIGSFVAEGSILPSDQVSHLLVSAGSDNFIGICGQVNVRPSVLNFDFDPPMIEPTMVDPFDEVDGYIHDLHLQLPLSSLDM